MVSLAFHLFVVGTVIFALKMTLCGALLKCSYKSKQKKVTSFLVWKLVYVMIIIDNFCITLFSGVLKLNALCNILQSSTPLLQTVDSRLL